MREDLLLNDPVSSRLRRLCLGLVVVVTTATTNTNGHIGPPFPLLIDVPAGEDVVSVWADPDIGQATFYIVLEKPDGTQSDEPERVSMWTQPVDVRIEKETYSAVRQHVRNRMQFEFRPEFDRRDHWNVGFQIFRHDVDPVEVVAQVESTPPGTGVWDLFIYLFPFAFVGFLWVMALSRMRKRRAELLARMKASESNLARRPGCDKN